ncbi:hypothetical protein SLH55_11895 [Rossellomorea sp. YZS02]|nr:hypothetical protein [Rossellomorea sp. YZS02]MDX8344178.1 hypothetical protein [Rossellomorea sp. YZS02]
MKTIWSRLLGDNWVHPIELDQFLYDSTANYSICIEGKGMPDLKMWGQNRDSINSSPSSKPPHILNIRK